MKKTLKKDLFYLSIIILSFIGFVILLANRTYIYGSSLDWFSQHQAVPDFFRTLFYNTRDFFPDFAANLGGGQNIYNFSYYGFLSPVILISYLLPWVNMTTYMIITSVLTVIVSAILLYYFLRKKDYNSEVCLLSVMLFVFAGSISLHSHRHIMFINYMPFLILGLFGVDKKLDNNRGWLLTLSCFLMIMTSYYYSIGGLLCLFIYALYKYLSKMNIVTIKSFFKTFFSILIPVLLAILMSSIITLPTLATLLNNRAESNITISLKDLLLPSVNTGNLLYNGYGLGLCAIIIPALVNIFKKNKANIVLGIILSCLISFNIFNYILNGTMYIDGKSLIPILPLYIYVIAEFLSDIFEKKLNFKVLIPAVAIISIFVIFCHYALVRYFIEIVCLLVLIFIYYKYSKKFLFIIPFMLFIIINSFAYNKGDGLVLKETYKENTQLIKDSISSIKAVDNDIYRISNFLNPGEYPNHIFNNIDYYNDTIYSSVSSQLYNSFYFDTLNNNIATRNRAMTISTPNIFSLMLNGDKYVISMNKPLQGYEFVSSNKGLNIYKNNNVLSYGFATSNVMSYEDFKSLPDQIKLEALLNVIVADTKTENNFVPKMEKVEWDYSEILKDDNIVLESDGSFSVSVKDTFKVSYVLPEEYHNKIILIRFKMNNISDENDLSIKINNVKNKLTVSTWKYYNHNEIFDYVLASQDQKKLTFSFTEGEYNIGDFETYILDYAHIEKSSEEMSKFIIDTEKTKGDIISGQVNVIKDGYFMLTIPYDKGFVIKVDGEETKYEKVDEAYIGFKIAEGTHDIEIEYKAPLKDASLIISGFGTIMYIIITFLESKRRI